MDEKTVSREFASASVRRGAKEDRNEARVAGRYIVRALDKNGRVKWKDEIKNLVTNAGEDHLLDATLAGGTQITTWYLGLINGASPTVAEADTAGSHGGWTENENYSESVRQTCTFGSVSSQSVDNSASVASFSIDTNTQTIGGAFLISNSTKGGTTGTLYSAGTFSSSKSVDNGDTLEVTYTATMAGS